MANSDYYPMGVDGSHEHFNWEPEPDGAPLELSPVEKLAVAQAFMNVFGDMTSTKKAGNLRAEVDGYFTDLYERTGAKSFDVKLLGGKVGTFSVVTSKPTDSREEFEFEVEDESALFAWAFSNGCVEVDWKAVRALFDATGEVPDGCVLKVVHVLGDVGGAVKSTRLKVDSETVFDAIVPVFDEVQELLLEEGV